jgi:tetratricopeptide (TPR) repeat protein
MKAIILILTVTVFISLQINAQRNTDSGGRGQESGSLDRIKRIQQKRPTIDKHPGKIERPPKNPVKEHPIRPPKRKTGVPIEGDNWNYCPEITPTCKVLVDNVYKLTYEEQAIQCFEAGDYSGAIINLNFAIGGDPGNPGLYLLRGKVYFESNDYAQAKSDFTIVNVLDPRNAEAYYYRGICNLNMGDIHLTREDFKISASLGYVLAEKVLREYF